MRAGARKCAGGPDSAPMAQQVQQCRDEKQGASAGHEEQHHFGFALWPAHGSAAADLASDAFSRIAGQMPFPFAVITTAGVMALAGAADPCLSFGCFGLDLGG